MTKEEMHACKDQLLDLADNDDMVARSILLVGARLMSVIFEGVIELDAINDTLKNVNATLDNINTRLSDIEMDVRPARRQ